MRASRTLSGFSCLVMAARHRIRFAASISTSQSEGVASVDERKRAEEDDRVGAVKGDGGENAATAATLSRGKQDRRNCVMVFEFGPVTLALAYVASTMI